jgi:hypothetical protein
MKIGHYPFPLHNWMGTVPEWPGAGEHFVRFPLNPEGEMRRMRGRRVRNEQDARGKLAQMIAHLVFHAAVAPSAVSG